MHAVRTLAKAKPTVVQGRADHLGICGARGSLTPRRIDNLGGVRVKKDGAAVDFLRRHLLAEVHAGVGDT